MPTCVDRGRSEVGPRSVSIRPWNTPVRAARPTAREEAATGACAAEHHGGGRPRSCPPLSTKGPRTASIVQVTVEEVEKSTGRQERILDAVLTLLSQHGISGVSMRAVARQAGVALGLVNYYYDGKTTLIGAALRRIEEQDVALVEPDPARDAEDNLRTALRRVAKDEFLTTEYLSLRLQLWALAQAHPDFAELNTAAQKRYRKGLAALIRSARPDLSRAEASRRATDIDIVQNGMWLTALLGIDRTVIRRSVERCEGIAFQ